MADLRAAVAAVEKELSFFTERTRVLGGVLAELTALSSNGRAPRRQRARAESITASDRSPRKRRRMSAAAKKAISVRMKKHWAEKKRAEK